MKEQEIYDLIVEDVFKYPLLNQIFAIRDSRYKIDNKSIYVNGYISLDVIEEAIKQSKEIEIKNKNITRELLSRTETLNKILSEMYNEKETKGRLFELYIETKNGDKIHKYFRTPSTFVIIIEKDLGEELYKFDDNGQLLVNINKKMYKKYTVSPIT